MSNSSRDIHYALLKQNLSTGVPPLGVLTSREPANLSERIRGEVSTSTAADAAELDAIYGNLPSYQPEPARGTEIEGTVVMEPISLPTISVSGCHQFRQRHLSCQVRS